MKQESLLNCNSVAVFSPDRVYRYTLARVWAPPPTRDDFVLLGPWAFKSWPLAAFIGLNPSTADETNDDPTVRRCMRFARSWGYGGLIMLNLFAYRATLPGDMRAAKDPVGPMNDTYLIGNAKRASLVVAAWGVHGNYQNRQQNILKIFREAGITLHCLRITKEGFPGHPLYLPGHLRPVPYEVAP